MIAKQMTQTDKTDDTVFTYKFTYLNQELQSERAPKYNCKRCSGTGIMGTLSKRAWPKDKNQPNKPCECGSGKKYKKCHESTFLEKRKRNSSILTCSCIGIVEKIFSEEKKQLLKTLLEETEEEKSSKPLINKAIL